MIEKISLSIIKFARNHFRNTWIHRIRLTSKIYKKLYLNTIKDQEKQVSFMGIQLVMPTRDTTVVPSIINQDYETFELEIFQRLIKKASIILDIGANIGLYSLIAAKHLGKSGKVYAFEPVPENQQYCDKNIALNQAKNIAVIPSAIGNQDGQINIYLAHNSIGTHSIGRKTDQSITVPITTIDSFVESRKIKPTIIKMDIEGYEGFALEGAKQTLATLAPTMLMEVDADHLAKCGSNPEKIAKQLTSTYRYIYIIDEKKRQITPLTDKKAFQTLHNSNVLLSNSKMEKA